MRILWHRVSLSLLFTFVSLAVPTLNMALRQVLHFRNCSETEAGAVRAAIEFGRSQVDAGVRRAANTNSPAAPSSNKPYLIIGALVLGCAAASCAYITLPNSQGSLASNGTASFVPSNPVTAGFRAVPQAETQPNSWEVLDDTAPDVTKPAVEEQKLIAVVVHVTVAATPAPVHREPIPAAAATVAPVATQAAPASTVLAPPPAAPTQEVLAPVAISPVATPSVVAKKFASTETPAPTVHASPAAVAAIAEHTGFHVSPVAVGGAVVAVGVIALTAWLMSKARPAPSKPASSSLAIPSEDDHAATVPSPTSSVDSDSAPATAAMHRRAPTTVSTC